MRVDWAQSYRLRASPHLSLPSVFVEWQWPAEGEMERAHPSLCPVPAQAERPTKERYPVT